ncbi:MAG TPA: DUF1028 domain-containing protein [Polyangiaceae bacterium]|nr:DUF1028 domain-containing protein [Polyangiaceae bacterium]
MTLRQPVGLVAVVAAASALLSTTRARATYSITAADTKTRELGGAGASCVPYDVSKIYAGVPNRGAVNAQAEFDASALDYAAQRLSEGFDAHAVLAQVTSSAVFPRAPYMQWGIVDVNGNLARATGTNTMPFAGDLEGRTPDRRFAFTTQGNILTSARVLERASAAFLSGSDAACDLAGRLMLALEAAGSMGEGDNRCTSTGIPAKSAYLEVTGVNGSVFRVSTPDVSPNDPTPIVRKAFDEYRAAHPCPTQPTSETPPSDETPSTSSAGCACSLPRAHGAPGAHLAFAALAALATFAVLLAERRTRRRPRVRN